VEKPKDRMMKARFPGGEIELYAVVYNAGDGSALNIRAFQNEKAAWDYGRVLGIEPIALIARKKETAATKLRIVK
jgi:hypothetical protein